MRGKHLATLKKLKASKDPQASDDFSPEELEQILEDCHYKVNAKPIDDFRGLSADQMNRIMYSFLEDIGDIVGFRNSFDTQLLEQVPAVRRAGLLIRLIGEAKEARMTAKGFLPKKIANAVFHESPESDFDLTMALHSESDALDVLALRNMMIKCGWIKVRNQKVSLTKSGQKVYEDGFGPKEFVKLIKVWITQYNWSFTDLYGPFAFLQHTAVFSLYLMRLRRGEPFRASDLTADLLRAFPMIPEMLPSASFFKNDYLEGLSCIVHLRLLCRFGVYFGLVESVNSQTRDLINSRHDHAFRTTLLFDTIFAWVDRAALPSYTKRPTAETWH